jgi:hypothetical protein
MGYRGKFLGGGLAVVLALTLVAAPTAAGESKRKKGAGGGQALGLVKPNPGKHLALGQAKREAAVVAAAPSARIAPKANSAQAEKPSARVAGESRRRAKVTVCHYTSSETNPEVIIRVSVMGWAALERKGDELAGPEGCSHEPEEYPGDGEISSPGGVLFETAAPGDLPFTGAPVWPLFLAGGILIASGLALRRFGNLASK